MLSISYYQILGLFALVIHGRGILWSALTGMQFATDTITQQIKGTTDGLPPLSVIVTGSGQVWLLFPPGMVASQKDP